MNSPELYCYNITIMLQYVVTIYCQNTSQQQPFIHLLMQVKCYQFYTEYHVRQIINELHKIKSNKIKITINTFNIALQSYLYIYFAKIIAKLMAIFMNLR